MADDLTMPSATEALAPVQATEKSHSSKPFRRRFLLAYGLLGALLGVILAALVAVIVQPSVGGQEAWSTWQPSGSVEEQTQQIAQQVSGRYRMPSGKQIVGVLVGPPTVQNYPVEAIAIEPDEAEGKSANYSILPTEHTISYVLCGFGTSCAIESGTPTRERERLLRLESLELALYTFRYADSVESVVTFLPPRKGTDPVWAFFFQRAEFGSELDQPLHRTVPGRESELEPDALSAAQAITVDRLTEPRRFRYSFQQTQDGRAVLVLAPAPFGK